MQKLTFMCGFPTFLCMVVLAIVLLTDGGSLICKTEDKVQAKQEILRKLVEAKKSAKSTPSASSVNKPPAEINSKS